MLAKVIKIEEILAQKSRSAVTFSPSTNNSDSFGVPLSLKMDLGYGRSASVRGFLGCTACFWWVLGQCLLLLEGPGPH